MRPKDCMLLNLFYLWIASMPFLAISPWQVIIRAPLYYGFFYYAILLAISFLVLYKLFKNEMEIKIGPAIILILLYLITACITLALNWNVQVGEIDKASGLKGFHTYNVFLLIYLIFNIISVLLISQIVNNKDKLLTVFNIITATAVTACVWGIAVVLLHLFGAIGPQTLSLGHFYPRLIGTATESQVFGNFLIFSLLVVAGRYISKENLINGSILAIVYIAMIMTYSIGAWIGAFIGGVLFCIINIKYLNYGVIARMIIVFMIALIPISLLALYIPEYSNTLVISKLYFWKISDDIQEYKITKKDTSDDKKNRLWMAQAAVNMLQRNPWKGIGTGNYTFLYNQYKPEYAPPQQNEKAHNAYLEILAETGIFGSMLFFSWLIYIGWKGLITLKGIEMRQDRLMYSGLLCGTWGVMVHGFGLGIFAHSYSWIACGLILAGAGIYEK